MERAAAMLKVLAHPKRMAIVDLLGREERMTVTEDLHPAGYAASDCLAAPDHAEGSGGVDVEERGDEDLLLAGGAAPDGGDPLFGGRYRGDVGFG